VQINFAAVSFMAEYFHNEADENMVVLLAVESGSRAWGFDSTAADRTTVFRLSS
jgi:hypothetical protein